MALDSIGLGAKSGPKNILTLNIRQGGGIRIPGILAYLIEQGADLLCLTEFRHGPKGEKISDGLDAAGYRFRSAPDVPANLNTVALFSKQEIVASDIQIPASIRQHLIPALIGDLLVIGVYFPQGEAKAPVFDWLLGVSQAQLARKAILIGDFNTGLHKVDEEGSTFKCAERFQALLTLGWRDAYRETHGFHRAYTWVSNRGNGFRVDHGFVSPAIGAVRADYDDSTRSTGVTDHSAMKLVLCT